MIDDDLVTEAYWKVLEALTLLDDANLVPEHPGYWLHSDLLVASRKYEDALGTPDEDDEDA